MISKGMAIDKGGGKPRPIVICSSFMRICDRLAICNVPYGLRRELMGEYQTIGLKNGVDIGNLVAGYAGELITKDTSLAIINDDAQNARFPSRKSQTFRNV